MGGDNDDESRQTISAAQLLSMGSCSAEEIGHIRLIVAWGNAFPAGTNGLSAMLEKGVELAAALQRQDTVCALQTQCVELGTLMQGAGSDPADEAQVKHMRKKVCEMLGRAGIDPNKSLQQQEAVEKGSDESAKPGGGASALDSSGRAVLKFSPSAGLMTAPFALAKDIHKLKVSRSIYGRSVYRRLAFRPRIEPRPWRFGAP